MKPIPHKTAAARVTMDGLGICGFRRSTGIWETLFLRAAKHEFSLSINGADIPVSGANRIEIITVNGKTPAYATDYPKGCFYEPQIGRNSENMRWAINLKNQDDVGEALTLKSTLTIADYRLLTIKDSLFYVSKLFQSDLYRVPATVSDPNTDPEPYRFGPTSDELTADVFCNPGGQVIVRIDGHDQPPLPYDPLSRPHEIKIANMCRGCNPPPPPNSGPLEEGDFKFYYAACEPPSMRYSFWGLPRTDSRLGRPTDSDRTDCNTTWSDPYP